MKTTESTSGQPNSTTTKKFLSKYERKKLKNSATISSDSSSKSYEDEDCLLSTLSNSFVIHFYSNYNEEIIEDEKVLVVSISSMTSGELIQSHLSLLD